MEVAYSSTHTRPRHLGRWVLRDTPQPLYPRERDPVPVVLVGLQTRSERLSLALTEIQIPNGSALNDYAILVSCCLLQVL
jgi:hypothetical protein